MKYRYVLALAVLSLATAACSKSGNDVKAADLFATVNGEKISKKEFELFVSYISNGSVTADKLTAEQRTQLVDRLVGLHLAAAEAAKSKLDQETDTASQINLWRTNILGEAQVKQYLEKSPITDAEIQAEYDTQIAAMPREYHASHILVKTKDEADALIAQLKKGADFAALAKKNSQDPGSAKNGGDLGWFSPSSMVAEFGKAVTSLQKGEMTETPVQTQYGFHIIKLIDSRDPTPPALADVKSQVETLVKNKKVEKYLSDLRKNAKVEIQPETTTAAASSSSSASSK
jgi:peptidyl-prolyl cis-trans isomerase C